MTCSRELIEAYLDEELGPDRCAEIQDHLANCTDCSATYDRLQQQRTEIRQLGYTAPAPLRQSVREALRREAASRRSGVMWKSWAIAASILLAVSLSWNLAQLRPARPGGDLLAANILSNHVRSLMENHLLDVASTDQHTVKPWFMGKLPFSPPVKDLASDGFPLAGGRLEYLGGRTVAALVYHRRKHVINVFVWPSDSSSAPEGRSARDGYNLVHWSDGGMTWWAVSDIGMSELEQFSALYRK